MPRRAASSASFEELGEAVVEGDGLPDVEGDGPVGRAARRQRAGPLVEAVRGLVEALAVGEVEPRPRVALAGREDDLAGEEELTAAHDLVALGEALDVGAVVAGGGDVEAADLPVPEAEAVLAGDGEGGVVEAGAAVAALAHVGAVADGTALRLPLGPPPARGVEQLVGLEREREGEAELRELVVRVPGVGEGPTGDEGAADGELDLEAQGERRLIVGGVDGEGPGAELDGVAEGDLPLGTVGAGVADRSGDEARGPGGAVGAVADEAGAAAPAGPAARHEAGLEDDVGVVAQVRAPRAEDDVAERGSVEGAEVGAPGDDARRSGQPGGEEERGALAAQVDGGGGGRVGGHIGHGRAGAGGAVGAARARRVSSRRSGRRPRRRRRAPRD